MKFAHWIVHRTFRVPGARERLRLCGRGVSARGGRVRCAESVARRVEIAHEPAFQLLPLLLVRSTQVFELKVECALSARSRQVREPGGAERTARAARVAHARAAPSRGRVRPASAPRGRVPARVGHLARPWAP